MALPLTATKNFVILTDTYRDLNVVFPQHKGVTLAQWAFESGWGQSTLASRHFNYAGMKWGAIDGAYGHPVMVSGTKYTAFTSATTFIDGFWHRIIEAEPFKQWHEHIHGEPEDFMKWLAPIWLNGRTTGGALRADEQKYLRDVFDIYNRRTKELFTGD